MLPLHPSPTLFPYTTLFRSDFTAIIGLTRVIRDARSRNRRGFPKLSTYMRITPTAGSCSHCSSRSRSEEHTSELQSLRHLVCRLLLEKKKKKENTITTEKKA